MPHINLTTTIRLPTQKWVRLVRWWSMPPGGGTRDRNFIRLRRYQ